MSFDSLLYDELTDEQLLSLIHAEDLNAQDYLINKFKNLVKIKSRAYFIIGADREDIIQEGMVGLYKAIRDYNPEKRVSFSTFAELCVTRQIISAIKAATRQKHIPLNSYISLNKTVADDESGKSYIDLISETTITSPEELLIGREEKTYLEKNMNSQLSVLESKVLRLYLQGKSYVEIAHVISKDEKAIDNAIQRVRRKVFKILSEKNLTPNEKYAKV